MSYERNPFYPSYAEENDTENNPNLNFTPQHHPNPSFTPSLPLPFGFYSPATQTGIYPSFGYDFNQAYRQYQPQQQFPPPPQQQQQQQPQQQPQQSSPTDSLNAALREGTDCLPRGLSFSRLPPLPRPSSTAAQQSNFGYIPEHFFYSPPQSPQTSSQQIITADPPATHNPAGPFTNQQSAGPSTNQYFAATSIDQYSAGPSTSQYPAGQSTKHYSSGSSSNEQPTAGPSGFQYSSDPPANQHPSGPSTAQPSYHQPTPSQSNANVAAMPSASASTPTSSSRKRQRPSFSDDSIPSATKRRIQVDLEDDEEDETEELGSDCDVLAKQREELVNKQREESNKTTRIGELNCMICLEHFTNMTATHCGHIFCHECLAQALTASQRSSDHNHGTCPACRKVIKPKGKNQIVPLSLMKGRKKK